MKLTNREKIFLLEIVRETIRMWLSGNGFRHEPDIQSIISIDRPMALENVGGFVTLKKDGNVIISKGGHSTGYPLYLLVRDLAIETVISNKIKFNEINDIDIEISVLTPLKKITSVEEEFFYGQHGIYMEKDGKFATLLPQETNSGWTQDEFLNHCASRMEPKSDWIDWKTANLFIFETIIFNEKDFGLK